MLKKEFKAYSVYGPPGTGKTTEMLRRIEELKLRGVDPKRIAVVSHTKAAASEALSRLGIKRSDMVSTIHSMCFRLLGLSHASVVTPDKMKSFSDDLGVYFPGNNEEIYGDDMKLGAGFLTSYNVMRASYLDREHAFEMTEQLGSFPEFNMFCDAYAAWKDTYCLLDFSDMLSELVKSGMSADADAMIIDEAQDLSPLQWDAANALMAQCAEGHIAGDDDQSLFTWAGADPAGMLKFEERNDAERKILDQSHRIPAAVHKVAEKVIRKIEDRVAKVYRPRSTEGVVEEWSDFTEVEDSFEGGVQTLILSRANYQLEGIERGLVERSIPYEKISSQGTVGIWNSRAAKAARVWKKVQDGVPLSDADFKTVELGVFPESKHRANNRDMTLLHEDWRNHVKCSDLVVDYLRGVWPELMATPAIKVGTIHSSKGRESDRVILLTELPERVLQGMETDPDSEARVFYVGVTRTRNRLDIIGGPNGYSL